MTWIRSVVAYGLSEYDPGVVAVPRGAGSIGWSVDSRFAPLNRLPYPGKPLFAVLSMPWVGRLCVFCK